MEGMCINFLIWKSKLSDPGWVGMSFSDGSVVNGRYMLSLKSVYDSSREPKYCQSCLQFAKSKRFACKSFGSSWKWLKPTTLLTCFTWVYLLESLLLVFVLTSLLVILCEDSLLNFELSKLTFLMINVKLSPTPSTTASHSRPPTSTRINL